MDKVKAGEPLIAFIKLCYAANRPPLLHGEHGVGKSAVLKQAARELGIDFIVRDLSLMEPSDLLGMPKTSGKSTIYAPPAFLPTKGKGLLAFEELNRCEKYMRAPCLQLLTERCLNDYEMPDGWLPAAAVNPSGGGYDVYELDPALRSRFAEVAVAPDHQEWLEWAARHNIHPAVVRYAASEPRIFESPNSSPRSWHYVSEVVAAAERDEASAQSLRAVIRGLVGSKRATAFLRFIRDRDRPLSAEDIFAAYSTKHRQQVRRWIEAGKLDIVESTLLAIQKYLQPKAEFDRVSHERRSWGNLGRFLDDLPGDLQAKAKKFFRTRNYPTPKIKR